MAEGIFNDIILKNNTQDLFEVDSAGTSDYHIGELPDTRTRKNAIANGLVLNHRARQFKTSDFTHFDYIIAMDDSNIKNINVLKPLDIGESKIFKMRTFDNLKPESDVPDPWFGGEKGFEEVYQILKRSCHNFYLFLSEKKS